MLSLTIKSERSELNAKRGTICTPVVMPTADWKMRRIQAENIEMSSGSEKRIKMRNNGAKTKLSSKQVQTVAHKI